MINYSDTVCHASRMQTCLLKFLSKQPWVGYTYCPSSYWPFPTCISQILCCISAYLLPASLAHIFVLCVIWCANHVLHFLFVCRSWVNVCQFYVFQLSCLQPMLWWANFVVFLFSVFSGIDKNCEFWIVNLNFEFEFEILVEYSWYTPRPI